MLVKKMEGAFNSPLVAIWALLITIKPKPIQPLMDCYIVTVQYNHLSKVQKKKRKKEEEEDTTYQQFQISKDMGILSSENLTGYNY
jgi:hypothetical protein